MSRVHVEGMGVVGCLLAWRLRREGIEFTWSDARSPYCAWVACTGSIYPSGDFIDRASYGAWAGWHDSPPWRELKGRFTEAADFWYTAKQPPNSSNVVPVNDLKAMRQHPSPSYHFNAQTFIPATQKFFRELERVAAPSDSRTVIAHGFNRLLHHYSWGWHMKLRLDLSRLPQSKRRAAVYCRRGLYVMAYAYPIPGSDYWYAGSSNAAQHVPKRLRIWPKYKRWEGEFKRMTGGLVQVIPQSARDAAEGWRPMPVSGSSAPEPLAVPCGVGVVIRPMGKSGVRHAPLLLDTVLGYL